MFNIGDLVKYKNGKAHYKVVKVGKKGTSCVIAILNPVKYKVYTCFAAFNHNLEYVKQKREASPIKWV